MQQSDKGFDLNQLFQEARNRWLKTAEVLFILQNHENCQLSEKPPQKPSSGSLFIFNKRVTRFFRNDGHAWRKKKSGRTVGEGHERLKVGNVETLNCYYAHGEQNRYFQRRSYWMLDPAFEHIVLVHYREDSKGRHKAGSTSHLSLVCSSDQSSSFCTAQNQGFVSAVSESYKPYQSSFSPGSVEVSSESMRNRGKKHLDGTDRAGEFRSPAAEIRQALKRLEEQLSLEDYGMEEISPYLSENEKSKYLGVSDYEGNSNQGELAALQHGSEYKENYQCFNGKTGLLNNSNNNMFLQNSGEYSVEHKESPFWKEMADQCQFSTWTVSQDKIFNNLDGIGRPLSPSERGENAAILVENQAEWNSENRNNCDPTFDNNLSLLLSEPTQFPLGFNNSVVSPTSTSLLQKVENSKIFTCSSKTITHEANLDYCTMWFDQENQHGVLLGVDSRLTLSQKQMFSIQEISPEWGYATEDTKVIITGYFLCDPSECSWTCMFGDIEVPVQIIQEGVLRCQAPPHIPGKVTLCITSSNRESCSEVREFEYRSKSRICGNCSSLQKNVTTSTEELLLLARFTQMLLCDSLVHTEDGVEPLSNVLGKSKVDEDPWGHIIEAISVGSETLATPLELLLQELLKEKFQQWLSSKCKEGDSSGCSLSKKEQGIIHMVAGLGFEWSLEPILDYGVSVNFRDVKGWTALHWAARFGREKMVAALIAAGASAGAVTDPTPQDPAGKTSGAIAAASGHKGLAGYLSEMALTSHLASLTLEESEISKGYAAVVAEGTVESISNGSLGFTEDQLSLKDSIAAVRNAAQAAARIQAAFRAYSFRRRKQKEAAAAAHCDMLSAVVSKLAFHRLHNRMLRKAALSIQSKYRGWKRRKEFLDLRKKVVMIQALVRGHLVRKKYKVIIWAVSVIDKAVLRWRRRRPGLRGFGLQSDSDDENGYEHFLKVFRKQKVDVSIEESLTQVVSMVKSPSARGQYSRILESYKQARVKLPGSSGTMQNDDMDELHRPPWE